MEQVIKPRVRPSAKWTSFEGWNYNGMKERLETVIASLNKEALLSHAEAIKGQKLSMSENFSAGQYWACFEMVAEDGSLVIARVRLPRHPNTPASVGEEEENYAIMCEITTMNFVRQKNFPSVVVPNVYAYERSGSQRAAAAGAAYMMLEGFYGNTLQDVAFDICNLPATVQEHIIAQWTMVQAQLATLQYSQIGSIAQITQSGEPIIGKLSTAAEEDLVPPGPFSTASEYFIAIGTAALHKAELEAQNKAPSSGSMQYDILGAFVFLDIVQTTSLFTTPQDHFPLNHMDIGTQNIIVDDEYKFLAIIDWEFAQAAPWQVNHYPMPFPILESEGEIRAAIDDPTHIAHKNVMKQHVARQLYCRKFREAEILLKGEGLVEGTFSGVLESPASIIYALFCRLGDFPLPDINYVREMVRLAFGVDDEGIDRYLCDLQSRMRLN
ncbi:hypothetical protein N7456_009821 [Penicillium angulare]|uniref:Aminoglycoside phosphotransferase domain-containing protein n=1 Tax=Penicillium angulare TaxID=116970 RepID=A0A9W9K5W9_9EURO|nr:hypothetical protein N7456_009821 [Penicillium angulare]